MYLLKDIVQLHSNEWRSFKKLIIDLPYVVRCGQCVNKTSASREHPFKLIFWIRFVPSTLLVLVSESPSNRGRIKLALYFHIRLCAGQEWGLNFCPFHLILIYFSFACWYQYYWQFLNLNINFVLQFEFKRRNFSESIEKSLYISIIVNLVGDVM